MENWLVLRWVPELSPSPSPLNQGLILDMRHHFAFWNRSCSFPRKTCLFLLYAGPCSDGLHSGFKNMGAVFFYSIFKAMYS